MSRSQCSGGKVEMRNAGHFTVGIGVHGPHDSHIPGCDAECFCQTTTCRGRDHPGGQVRWIMHHLSWNDGNGIPSLEHRLFLPSTTSPRAFSPGGHAAMAKHSQLLISVLCHQSSSSQAYFYSPEGCWAKCCGSHVTSKNTWNCFPPENGQEDGIYKAAAAAL